MLYLRKKTMVQMIWAAMNAAQTLLLAQAEPGYQAAIAVGIGLLEVIKQLAAGVDHFEQALTGMQIVRMGLEMSGEIVDACGQQCDLYFR